MGQLSPKFPTIDTYVVKEKNGASDFLKAPGVYLCHDQK